VRKRSSYDVFVAHASEDKAVARELVRAIEARGHSVWFDEEELLPGDSLRRRISAGLRDSTVGLVLLSHSFFAKNWTQWELDGLTARYIAGEANVMIPVWHGVTVDDVRDFSPPLADITAANTANGADAVADQIAKVLRRVAIARRPRRRLALRAEVPRAAEKLPGPDWFVAQVDVDTRIPEPLSERHRTPVEA
jgi:hypothetical protein